MFRLLALRGQAWYHGKHYTLSKIEELCALDEFRRGVVDLHMHDPGVSGEVLRQHGLWAIVEPEVNVTWTGHRIPLVRTSRQRFWFCGPVCNASDSPWRWPGPGDVDMEGSEGG